MHAVIVAQTPFHLFGALLIARLAGVPCDLWLIDTTLKRFLAPCRASGIWEEVHYAEKNAAAIWSDTLSSRLARLGSIHRSRRRIGSYLARRSPDAVFIFSDNHELTAAFAAEGGARRGTRVVLVEEGTAVHFSPLLNGAPFWKGFCRHLLGIPNPWGRGIGWSPGIDSLILTDPGKAHPEYLGGRPYATWPKGPYPEEAIAEFAALVGGLPDLPPAGEVDVVLLGTPFSEYGMFTAEEEKSMIAAIDRQSSGGGTWIKPHPFDTPGKYAACSRSRIFSETLGIIPAEILLHLLRPRLVISYFCSAAFNYCARYGGGALFFLPPRTSDDIRQGEERLEMTRIMERHFQGVPGLRLVEDLAAIPAAMKDLLMGGSPVNAPEAEPVELWRKTVASAMGEAASGSLKRGEGAR